MSLPIHRLLVLCEGNHCRSPIAEALLQRALGAGVRVASAGLAAMVDAPAHEFATAWAAEQGLDVSAHRGRQFDPAMGRDADLVLVMDDAQKAECERMDPSLRGRVFLLGHWLLPSDRQIEDPIRLDPIAHARIYAQVQRAVAPWPDRLALRTP